MRADRSDAPEYITRVAPNRSVAGWLVAGLIGTASTLGLLQIAGLALQDTIAPNRTAPVVSQPGPAAGAHIARPASAPAKDWDSIVEALASTRAEPQAVTAQPRSSSGAVSSPSGKQTEFSDANYQPRGADNVLSFKAPPPPPLAAPRSSKASEIVVVGQEPSMKDRACWPFREGSIERRNCRTRVGLHYRD